jgi:hypothetical protein
MSPLASFLDPLLREGRAVLAEAPAKPETSDAEVLRILQRAYATYRLSIAGPLLEFEPRIALPSAALVHHACWFLVSREETSEEVESLLSMPGPPRTPSEHLSADLLLRYLPGVHRRARAHNPSDTLTTRLAEILRGWPLSGVLADIDEPPMLAPTFGHPGLAMLYAERLAQHDRPTWLPGEANLDWAELVWQELGKDTSSLTRTAAGGNDDE